MNYYSCWKDLIAIWNTDTWKYNFMDKKYNLILKHERSDWVFRILWENKFIDKLWYIQTRNWLFWNYFHVNRKRRLFGADLRLVWCEPFIRQGDVAFVTTYSKNYWFLENMINLKWECLLNRWFFQKWFIDKNTFVTYWMFWRFRLYRFENGIWAEKPQEYDKITELAKYTLKRNNSSSRAFYYMTIWRDVIDNTKWYSNGIE